MAPRNVTPIRSVEPPKAPDEFRDLMHRFLLAISQLQVVAQNFGDLSELPVNLAPAGLVMQQARGSRRFTYGNDTRARSCAGRIMLELTGISSRLSKPAL